nr:MAG TPA: hypothetical protein [Caudoviricetes sp.]
MLQLVHLPLCLLDKLVIHHFALGLKLCNAVLVM